MFLHISGDNNQNATLLNLEQIKMISVRAKYSMDAYFIDKDGSAEKVIYQIIAYIPTEENTDPNFVIAEYPTAEEANKAMTNIAGAMRTGTPVYQIRSE